MTNIDDLLDRVRSMKRDWEQARTHLRRADVDLVDELAAELMTARAILSEIVDRADVSGSYIDVGGLVPITPVQQMWLLVQIANEPT